MLNLNLPYPYLAAIAKRSVCPDFYELDRARQDAAVSEVKETANVIAVGAMPAESYSERERLIRDAFVEYPFESWETQWLLSVNPPPGYEPEGASDEGAPKVASEKPAAPVAATKKEKK